MSHNPIDPTASIHAAIRRMCAFYPEAYRSVFDHMATLETPASLIHNHQDTMVSIAGLRPDAAALFESNWKLADSIIGSGTFEALQAGFSSHETVKRTLESLQVPKFEPVQLQVLTDFVYGTLSLRTVAEIAGTSGTSSLLARQGQLLSESYSSFINGLAIDAVSGVLGSAGLSAATANLERSTASLALLADFDLTSEPFPFTPLRPNWFEVFGQDLEARPEDDEGLSVEAAERTVAETPAGRLAAIAGEIITLHYNINVDSETASGEPIFRATSKGTYVAGTLSLFSVGSREEFDRFAEGLYYFLYEASGEWKRITAYEPNFPKVADRIKHFRLYSTHDTQHGSRAAIERKGKQVGSHLTDLISRAIPRSPDEWREAQLALLLEVADFLRHLRERITNIAPSA